MGVKYVKDFSFPSAGGFHSGSVQRYAKGGHVTKLPAKAKDSAKGMPARAKPNAPARGAPKMESKPKVGKGQGYAEGGRVPGYEMDRLPAKKPPGRKMDLAPARRFKGKYEGYAEGGPVAELDAGQPDYVAPKPRYQDLLEMLPEAPVKREFVMPPEFDEEGFRVGPDRGGSRMYDPTRDAILEQTLPPLPPIGALTPLPEEPFYSPQEQRGAVGKLLMPEDRSIYDRPRPEPVDRVGNRRAMMGDRRDMVMRPGMRGVARRAAPARMRAPAPVRQPAMLPFELQPEPLVPVFKKGGAVKGEKIAKVMREYKEGKLHSGSKKGPVVKNPKQAMAIALSEARAARKAEGGLTSYEESGSAGGSSVGFKEAFRKAREQGLKEFSWKGDRYSTKLKEQSSSERKVEEKAEPGRKGPLSRGGKRNVSEMSEYKRERKMELPSDRGTSYRSQGDDTGMSASERAGKAREYAMDIATAGAFGKAFKGPVKDLAKGAMRKASEFVGGRKLKQAAAERAAREATPEYKSKAAQMEKFAEQMRARQKMGAKYAEGGEVMSKGPKTRYTAAKGRRQSRERAMEKWAEQRMKHAEMYAPGKSLDMSEYAKGGKVKHADVKMDKAMVKKAVHKHERAMHPGKPMTKLNKGGVPSYGRKAMYGGGKC
jgi:hypothetical protein